MQLKLVQGQVAGAVGLYTELYGLGYKTEFYPELYSLGYKTESTERF